LSAVATGRDILAVANAYDELASAAQELAEAVAREDRSRSRRTAPRRARAS